MNQILGIDSIFNEHKKINEKAAKIYKEIEQLPNYNRHKVINRITEDTSVMVGDVSSIELEEEEFIRTNNLINKAYKTVLEEDNPYGNLFRQRQKIYPYNLFNLIYGDKIQLPLLLKMNDAMFIVNSYLCNNIELNSSTSIIEAAFISGMYSDEIKKEVASYRHNIVKLIIKVIDHFRDYEVMKDICGFGNREYHSKEFSPVKQSELASIIKSIELTKECTNNLGLNTEYYFDLIF